MNSDLLIVQFAPIVTGLVTLLFEFRQSFENISILSFFVRD